MKKYRIGLDIGTSSVKGVLIADGDDDITASARSSFVYDTDNTGKVEISAYNYLSACYEALKELYSKTPNDGKIISVCASSASGNILFLDENFNAISPIINWQDRRTKDEVDKVLGESFDTEKYFQSTGWGFDKKTFPLATLCRLKVNSPDIFKKASYLSMSTEYLYKKLTGEWGLSTSAGTPFYLIDQQSGMYRQDILSVFSLNENMLPSVVPVGSLIGEITEEASKKCDIPAGTPVYAGSFDHPSAARGVGITKPGELLLSCGTSWVGFYPLESREIGIKNHLLIDPFLSEKGGCWAGMVSLASVASRIEEYIRKYVSNDGDIYSDFEKYARQSESGANGLKITFDEKDKDDYILSFEKKHIARAIMEGVIRMLKSDFERLESGGIKAERAIMVGGPTGCPFWTEVIEEMTGIKTEIRHGAFAGAIGAARLVR